ncbi:MAG: PPC domain-containing protein [Candidatus Promineifilaceae bacterium]|nr:PPC domain-containing protein [Candidatus Promineifilaceae bacterium]
MNHRTSLRSLRLCLALLVALLPLAAFVVTQLVAPATRTAQAAAPPALDPHVRPQQDTLEIISVPPKTAVRGEQYTYEVIASDTVLTWTLPTGPSGMTITRLSELRAFVTWTPADLDSEPVVLRAEGEGNVIAEQAYTISVFAPTGTPTRTPPPVATAIYVDRYEPNNSLQDAFTTAPGIELSLNTLWPVGDIDYFRFHGKRGSAYEVYTDDLDPALDTFLTVYDTNGNIIATNDDVEPLANASLVRFSAPQSGFYFASVTNLNPTDPVDATYSIGVVEILGTATPTRVPSVDQCEPNPTFETACLIDLSTTYAFDFVPFTGRGEDNDFFRFWVKEGLFYRCETFALSPLNDTNMIFYTGPGFEFGVAGNDDKAPGELGSQVTYRANYTGWLYVLVGPGPELEPEYLASDRFRYNLECVRLEVTPTPTFVPKGGGDFQLPTPTPFAFTPEPTATPFVVPTFATPSPTPRPVIIINPLPTATPIGGGQQGVTAQITVYLDSNLNSMPELTEGIADVAVFLYDAASGQLLQVGFTNEAGTVRFGPVATTGALRVAIPFFDFSRTVTGPDANIVLRIVPRPLPGTIP